MKTEKKYMLLLVSTLVGLLLTLPVCAAEEAVAIDSNSVLPSEPEKQTPMTESVQSDVDKETSNKISETRKKIFSEAVVAINETKKAIKALEDNKATDAIKALEVAVGKLELILARDPRLALAPVDTEIIIHDLLADLDTVKRIIDRIEDYVEDGEFQKARPLMENLASEEVFRTTNIPLATYPDAIKAAAPLIDQGKIDKAKVALQAALNTLVITKEIVPLPLLRAQNLLKKAEELTENKERTDKQNEALANQLKEVRSQLKLAQLLGYGEKKSFKPLYEQLKKIEDKTSGDKSGKGWFDKIKKGLPHTFYSWRP